MSSTPWKEAATLIIVARASVTQKIGVDLGHNLIVSSRVLPNEEKATIRSSKQLTSTDYRVLMVKRSNLSSFMASAYVFPGGHVEISDYSSKWWNLFQRLGINKETLIKDIRSRVTGPRPPMIQNPTILQEIDTHANEFDNLLIPEIALRIAAIRETFEETGVALLTSVPYGNQSTDDVNIGNVDLVSWRQKVRENGSNFINLCEQLNQVPNIWSLYEWWDWLTPISVGHKRFDTMFYICCLNKQPKVVLDNTEVTKLKWCTPSEIINEHTNEGVFLAPPQVYELARLDNLASFDEIERFSREREKFGVQRWMPVIATYSDGAISLLPGDDAFPSEPDIIGLKPVPDFPETLAQMKSQVTNINRIELRGPVCTCLNNCRLTCGHLSPVPAPSSSVKSKL
ncbi:acyl-coenzyme A diphosphatase NUDT19-like [Panonychus citri]|uniref:acyl-coenzyme A diphosphatase NUDT19-like n=1 Tax=Panonychus citri TaxID=50023 RepID=UPI00230799B7|nr:acyl-coenzyme A diphosphatase NUDT19-like [Panonychus citri]XP_053202847.1 acyl-coenzyme A diphosphatase NUDT19-like [Panonychus citri]XP_053202848.1 acyl-coenzyme A diphosphatase NUDT19-like [Panonychus citri]